MNRKVNAYEDLQQSLSEALRFERAYSDLSAKMKRKIAASFGVALPTISRKDASQLLRDKFGPGVIYTKKLLALDRRGRGAELGGLFINGLHYDRITNAFVTDRRAR